MMDGVPSLPRSWFGGCVVSSPTERLGLPPPWGAEQKELSIHKSRFMVFPGAVFPGKANNALDPDWWAFQLSGPVFPGGGFGRATEFRTQPPPPFFLQRRASGQVSGWKEAAGEAATVPVCFSAPGPGLEGGERRGPQGRVQTVTPPPHPHPASLQLHTPPRGAPFAQRSPHAVPLPSDLAGSLVPGAGLAGTSGQPRQGGCEPPPPPPELSRSGGGERAAPGSPGQGLLPRQPRRSRDRCLRKIFNKNQMWQPPSNFLRAGDWSPAEGRSQSKLRKGRSPSPPGARRDPGCWLAPRGTGLAGRAGTLCGRVAHELS